MTLSNMDIGLLVYILAGVASEALFDINIAYSMTQVQLEHNREVYLYRYNLSALRDWISPV